MVPAAATPRQPPPAAAPAFFAELPQPLPSRFMMAMLII